MPQVARRHRLSALLDPARQGKAALRLFAAMVLSAASEGIGLLLLVPMLAMLGAGAQDHRLSGLFAAFGLPLTLATVLGLFALLVMLRAVINLWRGLEAQQFQIQLVDGLRHRAWQALLNCDWRVLSGMRQSHNASLLISEIDRIGYGVNQAIAGTATLVTLAAVLLATMAISPHLALAAAIGGTVVMLAHRRLRRHAARLGEMQGKAADAIHERTSENLGALRIIKAFGREAEVAASISAGLKQLRAAERDFLLSRGLGQIALQATGAGLLALTVWLAIARWEASLAEILPLVALFARALPLLAGLQESWQNWAHSRPAIDVALDLIVTAENAREEVSAPGEPPLPLKQNISLNRLGIEYSGRTGRALDGIDLTIPAGSIVAITGPSGAGKSTLADVLAGLILADRGSMTVDGVAISGAMRRGWRSQVAYVQQEPVLFSGTIRENLAWAAPDADEGAMLHALDLAAAGFVRVLPAGLDTAIGDSGRQLSGGERQRIVLARALLRKPALLILDEAANALDAANEAAIAEAIKGLRGRLTIAIICHGGLLGGLADCVFRLDQGRLAPSSLHEESREG